MCHVPHMNASRASCEHVADTSSTWIRHVTSLTWRSHVPHMNAARAWYEHVANTSSTHYTLYLEHVWVTSLAWIRDVSHVKESRPSHEWVMFLTPMSLILNMKPSCLSHECVHSSYDNLRRSYDESSTQPTRQTKDLATHCSTLQHTATYCSTLQHTTCVVWTRCAHIEHTLYVLSRTCMRHDPRMNTSRPSHKWVTSLTWMCHISRMN